MLHARRVVADSGFNPLPTPVDFDAVPLRNHLLASLGPTDLAVLKPHLETHRLEQNQVLFEANAPLTHVYFPDNAAVSLVRITNGRTSMAGTVGCEGMVGIGAFLEQERSSMRALTHLGGTSRRLTASAFKRFAAVSGPLHQPMLRYVHAFLSQIMETQECRAAHPVDQRCARWMLLTSQRAGAAEFPLPIELLALVIGVHRGGVLLGVRALDQRGLIDYRRGRLRILDRVALDEFACNCTSTMCDA